MTVEDGSAPLTAEELAEGRACCVACHAEIVVYPDECGLLPEEPGGDRYASHHWRACELHAEVRSLLATVKAQAAGISELFQAIVESNSALRRLAEAERRAADLENLLAVTNEQIVEVRGVVRAGMNEETAIAVRRALSEERKRCVQIALSAAKAPGHGDALWIANEIERLPSPQRGQ